MATKRQLKEYASNLEAILYLNSPEEQLDRLSLLVSENISLETKIDISLDRLLVDSTAFNEKMASLIFRRRLYKNKTKII
ncbi:hypothetical protein [Chryseobacterium sp. WLY505]|uniref:hypothetical protein n=1 Tax=Chryseobacterium sp. WLY505 TaxID=3068892 RepID=UPI002796435C|nr:hypothetical protein [Chryseobacterium sp. WLY505]MDQ1859262.1 hypothetical protein [Chryseobacterium sp. WLY505]